jgi:hypothetical protein
VAKKTKRIYFGPDGAETSLYWTVRVTDAKKPVTLDGKVVHALMGERGKTIGCGLSNMAVDRANAGAFPHPVIVASFAKRIAWIVDKVDKAGQPVHAVRYQHSYGHITDANDAGLLKKMVKEKPELMNRPFTLRVPVKQTGNKWGTNPQAANTAKPRGSTFANRGALARAVKAGRISKPAARQLSQVVAA